MTAVNRGMQMPPRKLSCGEVVCRLHPICRVPRTAGVRDMTVLPVVTGSVCGSSRSAHRAVSSRALLMTDADDAKLFAALARGDLEALEAVYDRHAPALFALAIHAVRDRGRAEDLLHDVFVELARFARARGAACDHVLRWLAVRLLELARR